jgi:hypothetical protein
MATMATVAATVEVVEGAQASQGYNKKKKNAPLQSLPNNALSIGLMHPQ